MNNTFKGIIIGFASAFMIVVVLFVSGIFTIQTSASVGEINGQTQQPTYKTRNGYVPDADTAVRIAEAVWLPIYEEDIYNEKPFVATLHNKTWTVTGSLPKKDGYVVLGGVAEIDISMVDGKVLRVNHGK